MTTGLVWLGCLWPGFRQSRCLSGFMGGRRASGATWVGTVGTYKSPRVYTDEVWGTVRWDACWVDNTYNYCFLTCLSDLSATLSVRKWRTTVSRTPITLLALQKSRRAVWAPVAVQSFPFHCLKLDSPARHTLTCIKLSR